MATTIFDVAKRAGVSIGTVSRTLNNRDRVHPKTRERILAAVQELNYDRNAFATGLATQQTGIIGLVIPQVNDPFYFDIVRGVEDATAAANYNLLIASQPRQPGEHRYLKLFKRGHVDGLILVAIDFNQSELEQIVHLGFPLALIQQRDHHVSHFVVDNYGGACQLVEHLIVEHGYKRIAYIAGTDHTMDSADRLRALCETLNLHGLELPDHYIVDGNYLRDSGYAAMQSLLALADIPEAVFSANDQMAIDAMRAIHERGLRVPDDIAVVGFDDISLANYVTPPLTTVHQPTYQLGYEAAEFILGRTQASRDQQNYEPSQVTLSTRLVIRRSCGCPA